MRGPAWDESAQLLARPRGSKNRSEPATLAQLRAALLALPVPRPRLLPQQTCLEPGSCSLRRSERTWVGVVELHVSICVTLVGSVNPYEPSGAKLLAP